MRIKGNPRRRANCQARSRRVGGRARQRSDIGCCLAVLIPEGTAFFPKRRFWRDQHLLSAAGWPTQTGPPSISATDIKPRPVRKPQSAFSARGAQRSPCSLTASVWGYRAGGVNARPHSAIADGHHYRSQTGRGLVPTIKETRNARPTGIPPKMGSMMPPQAYRASTIVGTS